MREIMKTRLATTLMTFIAVLFMHFQAQAGDPNINSLTVQGFLKTNSGSALADGSYDMVITLKVGGVNFWSKTYSGGSAIPVSKGVFSKVLTGNDDTANALNAARIDAVGSGDLTATVAVTINSIAESFPLTITAVPTAMFASRALTVKDGAIGVTKMGC